MIDPIFSILYQDDNNVIHTGTGFLVYKDGLFITAGHIFRGKKKKYPNLSVDNFRALFFDSGSPIIFEFKEIYFKSLELEDWNHRANVQRGPEYYDIAVGRINISSDNYLILDRRRPKINTRLDVIGLYSRRKYENNYGKSFEELVDINKIVLNCRRMTLKRYDALIVKDKEYYDQLPKKDQKRYLFNNCMTLDEMLKEAHGASGSPVLYQGKVVGMLLGSSETEGHTYILTSKYCSKSILYKSNYIYNAFEYLLRKKL